MQVARNFFLTREKTITRKLREALLAWKIEASLTKDEILELYVNQIFLGQRALRLRRRVADLLRQAAEGPHASPKPRCSPACPRRRPAYNPVNNPRRAKTRQQYVLRRMHELRFISDDQLREAQTAPLAVTAGTARTAADPRRVRRRNGAPGRVRRVRRGRLHQAA